MFKGVALDVVGKSVVGVEVQGLLIGCECLLKPIEVIKSSALAIVGPSIVGGKAQGLLKGCECLLIPLEVIKSIALLQPLLPGFLRRWGRFLTCGWYLPVG